MYHPYNLLNINHPVSIGSRLYQSGVHPKILNFLMCPKTNSVFIMHLCSVHYLLKTVLGKNHNMSLIFTFNAGFVN